MPEAPKKPCPVPGCPRLVERGYCAAHEKLLGPDARRESAARRGYGRRWREASKAFLAEHPLCAECARRGATALASVVDHIQPHRGDQDLFWDRSNWQPLCKPCHDRKTARESGWAGRGGPRGEGGSLAGAGVDPAGPRAQTPAK
jgi:5-methylcytosine-specific restriction protein A